MTLSITSGILFPPLAMLITFLRPFDSLSGSSLAANESPTINVVRILGALLSLSEDRTDADEHVVPCWNESAIGSDSNVNDEVEDDKYMEYINKEMNDDIMSKIYEQNYRFNNDDEILDSFSKIFKEYDMEYNPRPDTQYYRVRYLLNKIKGNVLVDLYNYFHTTLSENNKAYHIIPIDKKDEQTGSSINNIIINDKDLNKGILRVRYLNNRKLTNNLLKHDYKISKNMVNAIKFNKDLYKLSKNEMKIYHELQKFLNKEQDINVLIGSYLSGNNSKKLYNKISSMLYNKLKNGMINRKEYTKLINKINKI